MKFVIKKIPKLALAFYLIGFTAILIALVNYWTVSPFLNEVRMQQLFIAGAIVVAIGSLINTFFQFRSK